MADPRDLLEQADREIAAAEQLIHGLRKSYRRGCRCTGCRAANALYVAELRGRSRRGRGGDRPHPAAAGYALGATGRLETGTELTMGLIAFSLQWKLRSLRLVDMPAFLVKDIPPALWRAVKSKAAAEGITLRALFLQWAHAYVGWSEEKQARANADHAQRG